MKFWKIHHVVGMRHSCGLHFYVLYVNIGFAFFCDGMCFSTCILYEMLIKFVTDTADTVEFHGKLQLFSAYFQVRVYCNRKARSGL